MNSILDQDSPIDLRNNQASSSSPSSPSPSTSTSHTDAAILATRHDDVTRADLVFAIDRRKLNKRKRTISVFRENFPTYIIKDDPKPAIFIARKLFADFVQLASKKIETILVQESQDKPIFRSLNKNEDIVYDQLLEALGAISEFCLPSLFKILIDWYHYQLDIDGCETQKKLLSLIDITVNQAQPQQQQHQHQCDETPSASDTCTSPSTCNSTSNTNTISNTETLLTNTTITIRSPTPTPTPSTPDPTSNQISIASTLPLEYQSPSLTIVSDSHSSAANTSNSTATNISSNSLTEDSANTLKRLELFRTRKLLIEFTLCQGLIEIFDQLHLHPGHEDLISQIEDLAFEHFKYVEGNDLNASAVANVNLLADKFAEVIGVLARTRFKSVRKRFKFELNELKAKDPTPYNIQCIVTLLSGLKYFRVKMAPIEEFEASFQFLQELAEYFLEVRHKSIRHALAGLFVEIMVPLASMVKNEVKIPCLKNFVDTLWSQTLEMCARKKHSIIFFPLVTCLLCVSQRSFFLANWAMFLSQCISNLKNRDQKMCEVALESLYRLVWIYMIRIKCESNNVTQIRLQSIVDALFPRGGRTVIPRDANLNTFVDIIHFIAQERLDFAMRHIIFDLLSVDRPFKVIVAPERMNIALQAFLVIADSLQQKDGDPPMPKSVGSASISLNLEQGNKRRAHINKILSDDTAKSIGLYPYYMQIQKSFNDILRALDAQFGKPLLLTTYQNSNKDLEEMLTGERKPKIDLFKTCIAAIPRLMPEGMSKPDLINLLSKMTVHLDEEMRKNAFESLQILVNEFADWRLDVIEGFTLFLVDSIDESQRNLVDNSFGMLLQLLMSWRGLIISPASNSGPSNVFGGQSASVDSSSRLARGSLISIQTGYETISSRSSGTGGQIAARKNRALAEMRLIQSELNNIPFDRLITVMQQVERASLIMLCSCHHSTRKLASNLMRECRSILKCYSSWTCMEQFGFRSPDEFGGCGDDEDAPGSLRGSMSADNLSRITTNSVTGPAHSSVTSMNTQALLTTSVSKMCISGAHLQQQQSRNLFNSSNQQQNQISQSQHHDPYDSDIEYNITDCFTNEDNSSMIFWFAVIMLESDQGQEYLLALRLLKKILPNLPFERAEFNEEIVRNLCQPQWEGFSGLHQLVMRGCTSDSSYEISISLLDQLTPILKEKICNTNTTNDDYFPAHVIVLLTKLLSNYDDPTAFSLNIARRIAIWCAENSQELENLSTVMTLYSRRSFSKDAFQWIKCVVKYLHDAYPRVLPNAIPILVNMLEEGPHQVQKLIAPILYCILNYVDINEPSQRSSINSDLARVYSRYLAETNQISNLGQWREAVQIFKLIISRSSQLPTNSSSYGRELPGRTMNFTIEIESLPRIISTTMSTH